VCERGEVKEKGSLCGEKGEGKEKYGGREVRGKGVVCMCRE